MSWGISRLWKSEESNPSVFNKVMRKLLSCSYCKPHRVENKGHHGYVKHGVKKPKYKDHKCD